MSPRGRIIFLIAGAAGGLLCGWLIFGQGQHSGSPSAPPGTASAAPPDVPRPDRSTWAQRHPPLSPPSSGAEPHGEPHPDAAAQADELQQPRARVAELEKKPAGESKVPTFKVGSPVKPPEHLDPRFEAERIRAALNAAIKEAGLEGEVTAIDCGEYPCLAIGEMKGSAFGPDEAGKVAKALAEAGYGGDAQRNLGATVDDNGERRNLFGVALFPKTDGDDLQLISKRLHTRFNESQGLE